MKIKRTYEIYSYTLSKMQLKRFHRLVALTLGLVKVKLRKVKSETAFWRAMEIMTGEIRQPNEPFSDAVSRFLRKIEGKSHDTILKDVDRAKLFAELGIVTMISGEWMEPTRSFEKPSKHRILEDLTQPRVAARAKKPKRQFVSKIRSYDLKREEFYKSWEWRTLRMEALKEHGARCQCCGARPTDTDMAGKPVKICVDHIKPISKFWHLRLDKKNLQILCDECNQGKGAWDETDWRDGGDLAETAQTDELTAAFRATLQ